MLYEDLMALIEKYKNMMAENSAFIEKYELEAGYFRKGNLEYKEIHDRVYCSILDNQALEHYIGTLERFASEV